MIAFDFDLACASRLKIYDEEREAKMLEALGVGSVTGMLGGVPTGTGTNTGANVIQAGWSVPDAQA